MSLAAARMEKPKYPNMAEMRERMGFRLVAVLHERQGCVRGEDERAIMPVRDAKPQNGLHMDAFGGGSNAFGSAPLCDRLSELDSALVAARGERAPDAHPHAEAAAGDSKTEHPAGVRKGSSPFLCGMTG